MFAHFHSSGLEITPGQKVIIPAHGVHHPAEPQLSKGTVGPIKPGYMEVAYYWFFGRLPSVGIFYDASLRLILPDVRRIEFKAGIQGVGYDSNGVLNTAPHAATLQGLDVNAFPVHALIGFPPAKCDTQQWVLYAQRLLDPATIDAFEKHFAPRNNGKPLRIKTEIWTPGNVLKGLAEEISTLTAKNSMMLARRREDEYEKAAESLEELRRRIDEYRKRPAPPTVRVPN